MLINGKEVFYDPKKSQNIQDRINDSKNLPDFIKTEVTKKQIKDSGFSDINQTVDFGQSIESGIDNNTFLTGGSDLENRRNYYSTFQEMSNTNFIHRALECICDDACQKNTEGNTTSVVSDNEEVKSILEDLFHKRLNLNKELWSIFYETIKFGDNFYEVIPDSYENPKMIAKIRYLETHKVNRVEINGKLAFYTYTTDLLDENNKNKGEMQYRLQPWQIIHFKIEDKDFYPYGGSLLKSGVRTFRRLSMLEDAILVYRLARTPERRGFKIDVGNLSTIEANRFIQRMRDNFRTSQIIDSDGKINRKAAALSITQDIFIPVREGSSGTNIDTLQGGQGLNTIDDLKFFRDQILLTMNIPPEYLGVQPDGGGGNRGSLAVLDSKFARFVERIQYYIEEGLTKLAFIELFFAGKKKEELQDFKIELTPPSNIKEIIDIEFVSQKMNLIQTMIGLNVFPTKYILKNVLRLSNKEINDIMLFKELEDQKKSQGAAGMDAGMGMGGMPPMDMGGMPPMDMGAAPPVDASVPPPEAVPTLNQETLVNIFGKDLLIENKDDFIKLIKAAEDYEKEKNKVIIEEVEEENVDESLVEAIRKVISSEKPRIKKNNSKYLFLNGELDGLSFDEQTVTVYGNPRKRTGRKVQGTSDIIYEEEVIKIGSNNEGKKKKRK